MTNDDSSEAQRRNGEGADPPGWGLPNSGTEQQAQSSVQPHASSQPQASVEQGTGDDDAPLTTLQQAVVEEVTEGQRALGREMRWRRRAGLSFLEGGGIIGNTIDSAVASRAARQVSDSERQAEFLVGTLNSKPLGEDLHVPAGGPPTPEEVHEAEMNPWPRHNMAETIERNRHLRSSPGGSDDKPQA
jgi:hypothetical protein